MDERTTSYVENGQKKTGVTRPAYNANTDYSDLIQQAANAGDYNAAGYYEQQRNAKIAGTGNGYGQTSTYKDYYNQVDPARAAALEGGYVSAEQQAQQNGYLNTALQTVQQSGQSEYLDAAMKAVQQAQNTGYLDEALKAVQQAQNTGYLDEALKAVQRAQNTGYLDEALRAVQQAQNTGYLEDAQRAIQENYERQLAANDAESEAQKQLLQQQFQRQRELQTAQYGNLNRQLYTDMMNERRLLPDQLAAQGYNGGATESSMLRNRLTYEQALRDNEAARISAEKDIDLALSQGTLQQEIARQQAARQLSGDYTTQYANMLGRRQDQANTAASQYASIYGQKQDQANMAASQYASIYGQKQDQANAAASQYASIYGQKQDQANTAASQFASLYSQMQEQENLQKQQYLTILGQLQSQQNYEGEQALQRKQAEISYALEAAKTLAAYGDFSGYAYVTDLNGNRMYSDEQIAELAAKYQQQVAASSGGGGRSYSRSGSSYDDYSYSDAAAQGSGLSADEYRKVQDGLNTAGKFGLGGAADLLYSTIIKPRATEEQAKKLVSEFAEKYGN